MFIYSMQSCLLKVRFTSMAILVLLTEGHVYLLRAKLFAEGMAIVVLLTEGNVYSKQSSAC